MDRATYHLIVFYLGRHTIKLLLTEISVHTENIVLTLNAHGPNCVRAMNAHGPNCVRYIRLECQYKYYALLITELEVHTRILSRRLECQNKYNPYGPRFRLIRALLYTYTNKIVCDEILLSYSVVYCVSALPGLCTDCLSAKQIKEFVPYFSQYTIIPRMDLKLG